MKNEERTIIFPEFKSSRRYLCPKCGFTHDLRKTEIFDNQLARRQWDEKVTPWYEGRFPPFLMCGACFSEKPDRPAPRMLPVADLESGELTVVHVCKTKGCTHRAEMPESFPDGWKCPVCRHGTMKRKRWS